MKKTTFIVLAAMLAIFANSWFGGLEQVAFADRGGRGGHGDFGGHGRHGGGGHFEGGIWFGPGWGLWDPFFYPYYAPQPPVIIQQQPEEYLLPEQQPEETSYWYYCRTPKGYYPYVKSCPGGWMKVVPSPAPPQEED